MTRWLATAVCAACIAAMISLPCAAVEQAKNAATAADDKSTDEKGFVELFDGRTLEGWDGDLSQFRVEEECIIGGSKTAEIPHNFFLAAKEEFADFELRLQFRLIGEATNAGVQLRSKRIPDHHEMIGYQADLGAGYWGALYDESRRNKVLSAPKKEEIAKVLKPGEWNDYRILCEGRHIQLWINDLQTVDYTEPDEKIEQTGLIAVQIHGGPAGEAHYRNIRIRKIAK